MRLSKTKAMAFTLRLAPVNGARVSAMMRKGLASGEPDWVTCLDQCYMCCEHVPLEEMESPDDPGTVAEWFMCQSRKQHWQQRQMSPLGHLDIIAVGENLYMIHDKYDDIVDDYCETPLMTMPDFTLITLKEDS